MSQEIDQEIEQEFALRKRKTIFAASRERFEGSLHSFVQAAWPFIDSSKFTTCWAIEAFCEHLEAVTYGYIPRLLANYPPRASKTTIASICWPAWTWAQSAQALQWTASEVPLRQLQQPAIAHEREQDAPVDQ